MNQIVFYSVAVFLFWIVYKTMLSNLRQLSINRFLLLMIPILPLILWNLGGANAVASGNGTYIGKTLETIEVTMNFPVLSSGITFWSVLLCSYILGCTLMLGRTVIGYRKIIRRLKKMPFTPYLKGVQLAVSEEQDSFSFFNYVHINDKIEDSSAVLEHEMIHVRQGHSYDVLLFSIYRIFFWFHPMVHLLENELRLVHEYLADDIAKTPEAKRKYANTLLNIYFGTGSIQFINQFNNQKSIKMRLKMLSENPKKSKLWRYISVPALLVALALSSSSFKSNDLVTNYQSEELTPIIGDGDSVDKMPEYQGGMTELINFMGSNVKYPEAAKKNGVQGKVMIEFTVDASGKVKDATVVKGVDADLDKEALRVVNAMPRWIPGEKDGKKVSVKMTLPIAFAL